MYAAVAIIPATFSLSQTRPIFHGVRKYIAYSTQIPSVTNVDQVAVRESVVKAVQTSGYGYMPPVKRPSTGNNSAS